MVVAGLAVLLTTVLASSPCPPGCSCLWRRGKESLICSALSSLPGPQLTTTQVGPTSALLSTALDCKVLELSRGQLDRLDSEAFLQANLPNLQVGQESHFTN